MDGLEQIYAKRLRFMRVDFNSPEGQALATRYQVRGHPSILLIDRSGVVTTTIIGIATRERVEQAIAAIVS